MHIFTHTLPFHIVNHMEEEIEKNKKDRSRSNGVQISHFLLQYTISYLLSYEFLNFILVNGTVSLASNPAVNLSLYFWKSFVVIVNYNEIQWYCANELSS